MENENEGLTKILSLIPESLHEQLFLEVAEELNKRKDKKQSENAKQEISDWAKANSKKPKH